MKALISFFEVDKLSEGKYKQKTVSLSEKDEDAVFFVYNVRNFWGCQTPLQKKYRIKIFTQENYIFNMSNNLDLLENDFKVGAESVVAATKEEIPMSFGRVDKS